MSNSSDQSSSNKGMSRRDFLSASVALGAGFTILPSAVVSGLGRQMPSDTLNIAAVGVGGRGAGVLQGMPSEKVVALCDVDWAYAEKTFNVYPDAKRYKDWRVMLDEMGDDIDAVVVATSDHTHAIVAAHAMTMGKHVYVE